MKSLFKNRGEQNPRENIAFSKASAFVDRLQMQGANWMERKTAALSRSSWILIMTLFLLTGSGYSTYIIVRSIKNQHGGNLDRQQIQKNRSLMDAGEHKKQHGITRDEMQRLEQYGNYMDSLARSPQGKVLHDSIIRAHPGLKDSLKAVIKYYQLKSKEK